jgi:hypothetical protein
MRENELREHASSLVRDARRLAEESDHALDRARAELAALDARAERARVRLELARRLVERMADAADSGRS